MFFFHRGYYRPRADHVNAMAVHRRSLHSYLDTTPIGLSCLQSMKARGNESAIQH